MESKDIIYECLECGNKEIVKANDYRKDGRVCNRCAGHLSPRRYAEVGVNLSNRKDGTGYNKALKKL